MTRGWTVMHVIDDDQPAARASTPPGSRGRRSSCRSSLIGHRRHVDADRPRASTSTPTRRSCSAERFADTLTPLAGRRLCSIRPVRRLRAGHVPRDSVARMIASTRARGLMLAACGPGAKGGPTMNNHLNDARAGGADLRRSCPRTSSRASRSPTHADVKHILIGWKDLGEAYNGHLDARAAKRTKTDAEDAVKAVLAAAQGRRRLRRC